MDFQIHHYFKRKPPCFHKKLGGFTFCFDAANNITVGTDSRSIEAGFALVLIGLQRIFLCCGILKFALQWYRKFSEYGWANKSHEANP
jgi:hypothetical protein